MLMDASQKEHISLAPNNPDQEEYVCDSLAKSVGSLDELGLCMNSAISILIQGNLGVALLYEGWTYRMTPERYVRLPFVSDIADFEVQFKALLERIFEPYVSEFDGTPGRSSIHVTPGKDIQGNECFFVLCVLHFRHEKTGMKAEETKEVIQNTLGQVEDSHGDVSGRVFWLD
ncbi:MAG: hypothetical protein ABH837_01530 [bacterium]